MRPFLAAVVIGAAGVGYVAVQQSDLNQGDNEPGSRSLFDWKSTVADSSDTEMSVPERSVQHTIRQTRSEIASAFDEISRSNLVPDPEPETRLQPQSDEIVRQVAVEQTEAGTDEKQSVASQKLELTPTDSNPASGQVDAIPTAQREISVASNPTSKEVATQTPEDNTDTALSNRLSAQERVILAKAPKKPAAATSKSTANSNSSATKSIPKPDPEKSVEQDSKLSDSGWTVIGKSSSDLPIHSRQFGRNGSRTLVIAGMDGRDSVSVKWIDQLARDIARENRLFPANEIQLFRAGNPDGLTKSSVGNSHGVMINRNFPSRRFQLLPDKSSGPGPVSESETRSILDVLYSFRPRRVIHLTSGSGTSTVLYNRAAKGVANELQAEYKLQTQPHDFELIPGSVEDFSDGTLDASVITLQLTGGQDWERNWSKHLPIVMTAINGESFTKKSESARPPTQTVSSSRIPNLEPTETPPPKSRKGYEELPPPPR